MKCWWVCYCETCSFSVHNMCWPLCYNNSNYSLVRHQTRQAICPWCHWCSSVGWHHVSYVQKFSTSSPWWLCCLSSLIQRLVGSVQLLLFLTVSCRIVWEKHHFSFPHFLYILCSTLVIRVLVLKWVAGNLRKSKVSELGPVVSHLVLKTIHPSKPAITTA